MPNLDAHIRGFTEGDDLTLRRTINRVRSGLAAGVTITNAWLTVKTDVTDTDPGLFQKAITTADVVGTGLAGASWKYGNGKNRGATKASGRSSSMRP